MDECKEHNGFYAIGSAQESCSDGKTHWVDYYDYTPAVLDYCKKEKRKYTSDVTIVTGIRHTKEIRAVCM